MTVGGGATSMKVWADFLEPLMKFRHRCKVKMHHTALNKLWTRDQCEWWGHWFTYGM